MDSESSQALIKGSLRTLAQLVPMAGGAVAQAWSEYESFRQNQRIAEFFDSFAEDLNRLDNAQGDLAAKIKSMPDAAEILEECVAAAKKETSESKRRMFSSIYSSFLEGAGSSSPEERLDIVHHVEQLSEADLLLLRRFSRGAILRGDMITGTMNPEWVAENVLKDNLDWLSKYGGVVNSIAKLESRGLILKAFLNAGIVHSGSANSSFNQFRGRSWAITPAGMQVTRAIGSSG